MDTTPFTPATDYRTDATRTDGWTAERQALFLATLAHSGMVSEACREAGMSQTSAYLFRRRVDGIAFALGWKAAILLARERLEDMLLEAAIAGVETVTTKVDGVTRRRAFNSGLSMGVLNRLDRHAAALDNAEAAMARAIGSAFEEFIDLIASGCTVDELADFLEIHPDPLAFVREIMQEQAASANPSKAHKLAEESAIFSDGVDGYGLGNPTRHPGRRSGIQQVRTR